MQPTNPFMGRPANDLGAITEEAEADFSNSSPQIEAEKVEAEKSRMSPIIERFTANSENQFEAKYRSEPNITPVRRRTSREINIKISPRNKIMTAWQTDF